MRYDRRGWGASSAPDGYRRTTIEEQSEDAAVLLDSIDAGAAVVCGAGVGAVIALDLVMRRPELVAGAVLVEPPLLALLPAATEALSDDRAALQDAVADRGAEGAVELYLSGALLGPRRGGRPPAARPHGRRGRAPRRPLRRAGRRRGLAHAAVRARARRERPR